ncbi:hypothetical protein [Plantactinospora sp. KLBMP9567]|uniref:hypothetical protein n=1 Tax=Plantactinospora sp. KLBMP9567 TaxID=3085900 RepID=UPI002980A5FD|nr:hypothetical protein [Plantactinospora sp. KLBMP9567]MDW5323205.1 hypothetical protein [Plantactinospora sp. KLBMP9567]
MSYERSGAWTVDHAVRVLAAGCAQRHRPVPAVGAVVLGPESVMLRLATPDEAAPPGWTVAQCGRTWLSSLHWLRTAAVDDRIPEPYPLLVSAGVIDGGRLLLNLAQANGLTSIEGDLGLARSLARSWSRRLAISPWAAEARVIRVRFPHDPDFAGWNVSRLAEAASVLDEPEGGILFFADRPLGRDLYQVDRLLSEPARRWSVVAVGADDATWRFTVGMDGTVDTGLLAEPVRLRT